MRGEIFFPFVFYKGEFHENVPFITLKRVLLLQKISYNQHRHTHTSLNVTIERLFTFYQSGVDESQTIQTFEDTEKDLESFNLLSVFLNSALLTV